ncbi:MAG: beta-N-acetylhexosaminidase [Prevotella sp.]|nr:beta-N-acetylhexosaminidase [Prevotella sp.]
MKKIFVLISVMTMFLTTSVQAQTARYDIVPLPRNIALQQAPGFVLSEKTAIVYADGLAREAQFLKEYVEEMTQLQLSVRPYAKKGDAKGNIALSIAAPAKKKPLVEPNEEAYTLTVSAKGVQLSGQTTAAVFRGIQTLRKSLPVIRDSEAATQVALPAVVIQDEPRFAYRGMHLDCSRHFFPIDFVKKYIDLIALHGMNKFHWHLTDDQGWRFEVKKYPKLTTIGGWRTGTVVGRNTPIDDGIRHGGFYTQEECRDIVRYAAERHITVIPEIDMPGHMVAALAAYPEFGCTGGPYEVEHKWGVFADVLCPGKEQTFRFVEDVLAEVIDVFPSEYIHIGGDECPRDRWKKCELCQKRIQQEGLQAEGKQSAEDHLQGYFTKRVEQFLHTKGKRLIGWDELLGCNVDNTSTIMSWRGAEPGAKAAKLGHDVIMTPNKPMYFDHYQTDKRDGEPLSIGGNSPSEAVYAFEPVAADLSPEDAKHILGVQANVWAEYIYSTQHVEYQILPRMAALAEVQWLQPEQKNFEAFRERATRLKALYDLHRWVVAPHLFRSPLK